MEKMIWLLPGNVEAVLFPLGRTASLPIGNPKEFIAALVNDFGDLLEELGVVAQRPFGDEIETGELEVLWIELLPFLQRVVEIPGAGGDTVSQVREVKLLPPIGGTFDRFGQSEDDLPWAERFPNTMLGFSDGLFERRETVAGFEVAVEKVLPICLVGGSEVQAFFERVLLGVYIFDEEKAVEEPFLFVIAWIFAGDIRREILGRQRRALASALVDEDHVGGVRWIFLPQRGKRIGRCR